MPVAVALRAEAAVDVGGTLEVGLDVGAGAPPSTTPFVGMECGDGAGVGLGVAVDVTQTPERTTPLAESDARNADSVVPGGRPATPTSVSAASTASEVRPITS